MKDVSKLKGKIIVMRTDINTCYKRCLSRYNLNYSDAIQEEKNSYAQRKLKMYSWYKGLNLFLKKMNCSYMCNIFTNDLQTHFEILKKGAKNFGVKLA